MTMDARLLIVFIPVLAAASWALYNIGRVAIQQIQRFLANQVSSFIKDKFLSRILTINIKSIYNLSNTNTKKDP